MLKSLLLLLLLVASALATFAQKSKLTLADDPRFHIEVSKSLRFSGEMIRLDKSVRVFVGFTVTKQGHYQDVAIVNSGLIEEPFKEQIAYTWRKLPKSDKQYAGQYVLPVVFWFGDNSYRHLKEITNKADTIVKIGKYILLEEIAVFHNFLPQRREISQYTN